MSTAPLVFEDIFDPDFLRDLQFFHIRARQVPKGGRYAEQISRARGQGMEFRDFKAYNIGDDIRSIDWNIYQRLGRVFIKLFDEQRDLPLYMLTDLSGSMFADEKPRIRPALQSVLALTSVALDQHDSVTILPFSSQIHTPMKVGAGRSALMTLAQRMVQDFRAQGGTDMADALNRVAGMPIRRGLMVVISDFFNEGGIDRVVEALKGCRHRLLLVQLYKGGDEKPDLTGDLQLVDCETGSHIEVTITPEVLSQYAEAYSRFNDALQQCADACGAGLLRLNADADVLPQISSLFQSAGVQGGLAV